MTRTLLRLAAPIGLCFLAGCASSMEKPSATAMITWTSPIKRIFLDQSDVLLGEYTLRGDFEPRSDWTQRAQGYCATALVDYLAKKGLELVASDSTLLSPNAIHDSYGADYELSLSIRDSYTSSGRVAGVAGVVLFCVVALPACLRAEGDHQPTAPRMAAVSLVDLRNGDTVWTKSIDSGGFNQEANARNTIQRLLAGSPL